MKAVLLRLIFLSDVTLCFPDAGLLTPQTISKWIIFAPNDQQRAAKDLVKTLQSVGRKLGMDIADEQAV